VQLREAAAPLAKPQPGRAEPARSGNPDAAKADIAKLAELREKLKHPVTPGVPTPARELYGLMLLEHARKDDTRRSLEAEQVFPKHSAKCSIASYIRPIG
jgi:hypothetical protein